MRADYTINFGIDDSDYSIGRDAMLKTTLRLSPGEDVRKEFFRRYGLILPKVIEQKVSANITKFASEILKMKAGPYNMYTALLNPAGGSRGIMMLPGYFELWQDQLNKNYNGHFVITPNLNQPNKGRRFFFQYYFGVGVNFVPDAKLDELYADIKMRIPIFSLPINFKTK